MSRVLTAIAGLLLVAGCVNEAPTLPPPPMTEPREIEPTKDWEDWGPEANQRAREAAAEGTRLTTAQIKAAFSGKVLRGCYPNGQRFAERLDADGRFFDAQNNDALLGTWRAEESQLCFRYPERANQGMPDSCFAVMRVGDRFDFYLPNFSSKVASTACTAE